MIFIIVAFVILIIFIVLGMKPVCPDYGRKMYESSYDPCIARVIWKCSRCSKEFI